MQLSGFVTCFPETAPWIAYCGLFYIGYTIAVHRLSSNVVTKMQTEVSLSEALAGGCLNILIKYQADMWREIQR
ncbi:hypothetical protein DC094_00435 [Pelagibaculum spongiae]|uniref:Uncharacterized protein n=1 Tax=Pelagibaculum spongiae TaxID=2080658 RepID=A0A2V1H2V3_9GAMM|nr:hypothetical protein DC094_00435 [Pelagibaculum spongiae]